MVAGVAIGVRRVVGGERSEGGEGIEGGGMSSRVNGGEGGGKMEAQVVLKRSTRRRDGIMDSLAALLSSPREFPRLCFLVFALPLHSSSIIRAEYVVLFFRLRVAVLGRHIAKAFSPVPSLSLISTIKGKQSLRQLPPASIWSSRTRRVVLQPRKPPDRS